LAVALAVSAGPVQRLCFHRRAVRPCCPGSECQGVHQTGIVTPQLPMASTFDW